MIVHWATLALKDIKDALDDDCYDTAAAHIEEAIASIRASQRSDFIDTVQGVDAGPKIAATSH